MLPIAPSTGTQINDLLGKLGIPGGQIGAMVDALAGNRLGVLQNLRDAYYEAATGHATTGEQRELFDRIAPSFFVPSPSIAFPDMSSFAAGGYASLFPISQRVDLGLGTSMGKLPFFMRLFGGGLGFANPIRENAARFERALHKSPLLRSLVEAKLGGRIRLDGKYDGKITVSRFARTLVPGAAAVGALFPTAASAMGWLSNIANATGGLKGNNLLQMITGGLGSISDSVSGDSVTASSSSAGFQGQCDAVMADTSLSIEDKVVLFLMLIMNKMDQQIEDKMKEINELQQKQKNKKKKGGLFGKILGIAGTAVGSLFGPVGTALGSAAGSLIGGAVSGSGNSKNDQSIDVETMKLKRMIDKRSQMFDMLRQIIDKYNETAKNMIQSMGR